MSLFSNFDRVNREIFMVLDPLEPISTTIAAFQFQGAGMAYWEVSKMEIAEVILRWQVRAGPQQIPSGTCLSRNTVRKCVVSAKVTGIAKDGPPPGEEQLSRCYKAGLPAGSGHWGGTRKRRLNRGRNCLNTFLACFIKSALASRSSVISRS